MKSLPADFLLTSIAFLTGVAVVAISMQYRNPEAVFREPAGDDMGTSGIGYESNARPGT